MVHLLCSALYIFSVVGTTGAPGAGAPIKIIVSSIYTCSFFTPTPIALSCSARTDVLKCSAGTDGLNCSAGTDGTETDRFFLLPTKFFSLWWFFLIQGKCIIENSDVSQ